MSREGRTSREGGPVRVQFVPKIGGFGPATSQNEDGSADVLVPKLRFSPWFPEEAKAEGSASVLWTTPPDLVTPRPFLFFVSWPHPTCTRYSIPPLQSSH